MQDNRSLTHRARYLCVILVLAGLSHFVQSCNPPPFDSLCPECGAEMSDDLNRENLDEPMPVRIDFADKDIHRTVAVREDVGECKGVESPDNVYASQFAEYAFSWETKGDLRIFFVPDNPAKAVFLIVHYDSDPEDEEEGQFQPCRGSYQPEGFSADAYPFEYIPGPLQDIRDADAGQYSVWLGSEEYDAVIAGTLYVAGTQDHDGFTVRLDPWGEPENVWELGTDFFPDPQQTVARGVGTIATSYLDRGDFWGKDDAFTNSELCEGFAAGIDPVARLTWSGTEDLRIYATGGDEGNAPPVLIVHDSTDKNPATGWYCRTSDPLADQADNPLLSFTNSGGDDKVFNIWVANHERGGTISATVYASRLDFDTTDPSGVITKAQASDTRAFSGDTVTVSIDPTVALVDAGNLHPQRCKDRFASRSPNLSVEWTGGDFLAIHFLPDVPNANACFLVNDPKGNGDCYCSPKGKPKAEFEIPTDGYGAYSVWVGSLKAGDTLEGTLCITGSRDIDPDEACKQ